MGTFTCSFVFVFVLIIGSYGMPQRDSAILGTGECTEIMDIAILADISQSMKDDDRKQLITIVNGLVDKLGVSADGNHFSLITFGDNATLHNKFTDTSYFTAETFKRSVARELFVKPRYEGTRTDLAENLAVTKVFTPEGGDRRNVKNVMIIVTDGNQYIDKNDSKPYIPFSNSTKALEEKGVAIKLIGVGIKDEAGIGAKMEKMAGKKGKVVFHSNFTELSKKLYKQFKEIFCYECKEIMDIAILADISLSMDDDDRKQLIRIVNGLVDKLGVSADGNHFSLITFGRNVTVHNNFTDTSYFNGENFTESVDRELIVKPKNWSTRTDLAMNLALTKVFTPEGGDRLNVTNVMLIFTDGAQYRNVKLDEKEEIPFLKLTKALEEKNVKIIVIGVGKEATDHKTEMAKMAGEKGTWKIYDNFQDTYEEIYKLFKETFCPPTDGNFTEWSRPPCSATCGGGIQTLRRTCTNPPPSNGGRNCIGPAEKTVSCNEGKCPTACLMDVAFILDSSRSIPRRNFVEAKRVVKELLETLDLAPDKSRIALVEFSTTPSLKARFGQFDTEGRAKDAVQKLPKEHGITYIYLALDLARKEILPYYRDGSYKMIIVFTDGVQSTGARGLKQFSKPLRDAGVHVIAVGIGPGKNERRLRLMTDHDEDVVDAKSIKEHIQKIRNELNKHNCALPKAYYPPSPVEPECIDEPTYAQACEKYANEVYCWDNPDFCAISCANSCKLCG